MRAARFAPWMLAGILASGCHTPVAEVDQQPVTTRADEQPVTTKVEECSWCPAPDPSGTTGTPQPASAPLGLMDQLAAAGGGTAFADIGEDQLLSDIRSVCEAWKGDTSLEDVTATVSAARAELLGVSEPEPGSAAYTGLLHSSAEARCLRDPTA